MSVASRATLAKLPKISWLIESLPACDHYDELLYNEFNMLRYNCSPNPAELEIPESLRSDTGFTNFPELTPEILESLRESGWSRVGVGAIVVNPLGEILILEHQPDSKGENKIPHHERFSIMTETSYRFDIRTTSPPPVEQPIDTLVRGFYEELGVKDLYRVSAFVSATDPWIFSAQCSVGGGHADESILALCAVIFVDESGAESLVRRYRENAPEISAADFVPFDMVASLPLRDGVLTLLDRARYNGFLDYTGKFKPLGSILPQLKSSEITN